jgi:hypothetical protein
MQLIGNFLNILKPDEQLPGQLWQRVFLDMSYLGKLTWRIGFVFLGPFEY